MRNIADKNGPRTNLAQGNPVQRVDGGRGRIRLHNELLVADLRISRWQRQALRIDRIEHIVRGDARRLQGTGIKIDHDLPVLSTIRRGQRNALDGRQRLPELVNPIVVKLLLVHPVRA